MPIGRHAPRLTATTRIKGNLRHDLGGEGAAKDFNAGDQPTPVRKFEGRGWAPMDKVTQANTFTGQSKK